MNESREWMTVQEVADKMRVTPQYIRKLIKEKKINACRFGNQWVITQTEFQLYLKKNDVVIEPEDHKRLGKEVPPIVALSFFSGAMGLDIGMKNGGIQAILACECNKYCRMTIEKNAPDMALIGDINDYDAEQIMEFARIPEGRKVDVIFGGPPCQAFSTAGARRGFSDERGNVFLKYIEIVKKIRPTYVVIENVRGILSAAYPKGDSNVPVKGGALSVILERLKDAGYTISFELYNAANFGAPQIRERIVIIGKLGNEKVSYLQPISSKDGQDGLPKWKTLKDAVEDIENMEQHYIEFPERRLKYYRMLTEGQYWKDLPVDIQREAMGKKLALGGGKTGFYRRLSFDKPSPTLVTNPTMPATDLCHPVEDRPLSVEEYRRIQGFPDEWKVCGPILEQYKQIGNAVPIKLGEAIARTIIDDINGVKSEKKESCKYSRYRNTSDVTWKCEENLETRIEKSVQISMELDDLKGL